MTAKPKLYQYAACPFCWKVRAALAYKGIIPETVEVNPLNNKEISFLKDYDKVPVYVDGSGTVVKDSTAIMRHIDDEFPGRRIFESDASRKNIEEKWLEWAERRYVQGLPPAIYDTLPHSIKAFDYITHTGNFPWFQKLLIKYSGALVMTLVAKKIKKRLEITDPQAHLRKMVGEWSQALGGQAFLGGERPNGADLAVFGISKSIENLPAAAIFRENPSFAKWFGRMSEQVRFTSASLPA